MVLFGRVKFKKKAGTHTFLRSLASSIYRKVLPKSGTSIVDARAGSKRQHRLKNNKRGIGWAATLSRKKCGMKHLDWLSPDRYRMEKSEAYTMCVVADVTHTPNLFLPVFL